MFSTIERQINSSFDIDNIFDFTFGLANKHVVRESAKASLAAAVYVGNAYS